MTRASEIEEERRAILEASYAESGQCAGCGALLAWWEERSELCAECARFLAEARPLVVGDDTI